MDKIYSLSRLFFFFEQTAMQDKVQKAMKGRRAAEGLGVLRPSQTDTLPSWSTGVCDDRGVRAGVHHPNLVGRMLLSLPRVAGTPTLRPQAFLCYR